MTSRQTRPGGRTEAVRQRALAAVIEELSEPARLLSYDSLAKRAEINRATLYRNWPEPAELIAEALGSVLPGLEESGPLELREALLTLAHEARAVLRSAPGRTLIANVMAAAQHDPVIGEAIRAYWQARIGHASEVSGVPAKRVRAAVSAVAGRLLFEGLMFQREVPEAELRELIEAAINQ